MGKSLSLDIRERVVALVDGGCHATKPRGAQSERAGSRLRRKDDRDAASWMRSLIGSGLVWTPSLIPPCPRWPKLLKSPTILQ
jgi:hypothetical protein